MARLPLSKREKNICAVYLFWMEMLHVTNFFFDMVCKVLTLYYQSGPGSGEESSARKRKRKRTMSADIVSASMDAAALLGAEMKAASSEMSKAMGASGAEMRSKLNEELVKVPGLTMSSPGSDEESSARKRKRKRKRTMSADIVSALMASAAILGAEIKAASSEMSKAMGASLAEMRSKLNEELVKVPGLTMTDRFKVLQKIGRNPSLTQIFFTLSDEEKVAYVKHLQRGGAV